MRSALLCLFLAYCSCGLAQSGSCTYQFILMDSRGDGWNGGELTVRQGNRVRILTMTPQDGRQRTVFLPIVAGRELQLSYARGAFPEETAIRVLNNNDEGVYAIQSPPDTDRLATLPGACVACAPPARNSLRAERVRFDFVRLRFNAIPEPGATYLLEYGRNDFDPLQGGGLDTLTLSDTTVTITNLDSDSTYTFFLSAVCPTSGDTTARRGPLTLTLPKRADVGVGALLSPLDDCGLSRAETTIGVTNFGGQVQSFFPVNFSVDGGDPLAPQPLDGIFTGIVGVDSTESFTFDPTQATFGPPGLYTIRAWTELEDDQDRANDTLTTVVRHIRRVGELPYREDFSATDGDWFAERAGRGPSSWAHGPLVGRPDSGWATNPDGDYNDNELSYLNSPCFDLGELAVDPVFSVLLSVDTEEDFDALWLESSVDGGTSWRRVRSNPGSVFWYNDLANQQWEGRGGNGGRPAAASTVLDGLAGQPEVRFRFVFRSSRAGTRPGVTIGNVRILERQALDLAVSELSYGGLNCATAGSAALTVTLANPGLTQIQDVELVLEAGPEEVFVGAFDSLDLGPQQVRSVQLPLDSATVAGLNGRPLRVFARVLDAAGAEETELANNVGRLSEYGFLPVPFAEDLENGVPRGWLLDDDLIVGAMTGAASATLFDNLSAADPALYFRTADYGRLRPGDSLRFELSFADFVPDTLLTGVAGELTVNAIVNCGDTVNLLTRTDSVAAGTYRLDLSALAGRYAGFEFRLTRGGGDFIVEFDNFSVGQACPADLAVGVDILAPSAPGAADATVTLVPEAGLAPYTYVWSNDNTTASQDSIPVGDYTVAITDARGCTDTVAFSVDFVSSATGASGLLAELRAFPNPTGGLLQLRADLPRPARLAGRLFDVHGRELAQFTYGRTAQLAATLSLADLPAGLYLLRLTADGEARTLRLLRR